MNAIDNPVDVAWRMLERDACREIYQVVLEDDGVDGLIVASNRFNPGLPMIKAVMGLSGYRDKPVILCFDSPGGMSDDDIKEVEDSGIPAYPLPERAVAALAGLARYGMILRATG